LTLGKIKNKLTEYLKDLDSQGMPELDDRIFEGLTNKKHIESKKPLPKNDKETIDNGQNVHHILELIKGNADES